MWWMAMSAALAGPIDVEARTALRANDPFTNTGSVDVLVAYRPDPVFAVEVGGSVTLPRLTPPPHMAPFSPRVVVLLMRQRLSPEISRTVGHGWASTAFTVLDGVIGNRHASRHLAVDAVLSLGMVRTQEDLRSLQADSDPAHPGWLTARQTHVFHGAGLRARLDLAPALQLVVHTDIRRYAEVVNGDELAVVQPHWMGLGLRWSP